MLELFFKNNQAPALNSDNLNRIISEINEVEATGIQNKARTMDLQSEIARLVIEKGGSIVQANPEEEGSENITSILIDDKVYKISIEGIGDLERRIETVETDKADELTMNTGINISDWDRDIDPDVPVIVDKYTNYHDAVSKISQQIDVMGNRTDDLKTSLNGLETDLIYKFSVVYSYNGNLNDLPAFSVAECLNSCTNLPFGTLYSTVITIRMASNPNFAHQLCISGAIGHDRNTNFMAIRTKWSGSWGNWVTIK